MNRKLLMMLLIFLTVSFCPTNVKGVLERINLPPNYYYYEEVEAGNMDLISWNFESTGAKVDLYLMEYDDFKFYESFPFEFVLEELGDKLAGHSSEASGQFRPPHSETWYFVFLNPHSNDETANLKYEINKFPSYYIIIPIIIVFVIGAGVLFVIYYYYDKTHTKEKEPSETQSTTVPVQERVAEEPQKEKLEFCPLCGNKILNPEAKFCDKCGADFNTL